MKQNNILKKPILPFTMVPNVVIDSPNLSLQAKGLFSYLMSKPDGWVFSSRRIANQCKESFSTINRILKELEETELLKRTVLRGEDGKVSGTEYEISSVFQYKEKESQPEQTQSKPKVLLETRKEEFASRCKEIYPSVANMTVEDARNFFKYWTEKNKSGTRMKFEMQQTFEIKLRMETWMRNKNNRGKTQQVKQEPTYANT